MHTQSLDGFGHRDAIPFQTAVLTVQQVLSTLSAPALSVQQVLDSLQARFDLSTERVSEDTLREYALSEEQLLQVKAELRELARQRKKRQKLLHKIHERQLQQAQEQQQATQEQQQQQLEGESEGEQVEKSDGQSGQKRPHKHVRQRLELLGQAQQLKQEQQRLWEQLFAAVARRSSSSDKVCVTAAPEMWLCVFVCSCRCGCKVLSSCATDFL